MRSEVVLEGLLLGLLRMWANLKHHLLLSIEQACVASTICLSPFIPAFYEPSSGIILISISVFSSDFISISFR